MIVLDIRFQAILEAVFRLERSLSLEQGAR
jgi:hypothetical protein